MFLGKITHLYTYITLNLFPLVWGRVEVPQLREFRISLRRTVLWPIVAPIGAKFNYGMAAGAAAAAWAPVLPVFLERFVER